MRRWTILATGAALWPFLAAIPALADGGPHTAATNSGVSSLTADSCAGCHRAHTAQGAMLINASDEEALCLTCHGAAGTGATTDVMTGVQYTVGTTAVRGTTQLGALRGGGFDQARIGSPFRYNQTDATRKAKVEVGAAANVTSSHLAMTENGLTMPHVAWGNGANGSGAGPSVTLECASCHNPHGNGQYRILNPVPSMTGGSTAWTATVFDVGVSAANTYRTVASHGLLVGDTVTVAGVTGGTANVVSAIVATVPASNQFTAYAAGTTTTVVTGSGTGGTATRIGGVKVKDPALPAGSDARNYTVIQTASPYLLYASQVVSAGYTAAQGDYWARQVPWSAATSNQDAPNGYPAAAGSLATSNYVPAFNDQITLWCAQCHSRYFGYQQPTTNPANGSVGAAYANARPGDNIFKYQHSTRSNRSCNTCHVAHGSNAVMDGAYSSTVPLPNGTASASSRLLKVGNRGTCELCHDPTGTAKAGDQFPPAPYAIPATP